MERGARRGSAALDSDTWRSLTSPPRWSERSDIEVCRTINFSPPLLLKIASAQLGAVDEHRVTCPRESAHGQSLLI